MSEFFHVHTVDTCDQHVINLITLPVFRFQLNQPQETVNVPGVCFLIQGVPPPKKNKCENPAHTKPLFWKYFHDVQVVGTYLFMDFL